MELKRNIKVHSGYRGFLVNLFKFNSSKFSFKWRDKGYEIHTFKKKILNKIAKSYFFDIFGIIKVPKINIEENDLVFSYNKFLNVDGPYIIYLENPYALSHYSIRKTKTKLGKRKLNLMLNDGNLKAIVCMSDACYNLAKDILPIPENVKISRIYPLIPNTDYDYLVNIANTENETIQCLFISSEFELKGGQEILNVFDDFLTRDMDTHLTIVTPIGKLTTEQQSRIEKNQKITLLDFTLDRNQLNDLYKSNHIYLNPTKQDSFPMVILEALKYGNAIITSDLFAIPEMVKDGLNGFLLSPYYRFFNKDGTANQYVWENRKKTIYSKAIDTQMQNQLQIFLNNLINDRILLSSMRKESYKIANFMQFDDEKIITEWERLFLGI